MGEWMEKLVESSNWIVFCFRSSPSADLQHIARDAVTRKMRQAASEPESFAFGHLLAGSVKSSCLAARLLLPRREQQPGSMFPYDVVVPLGRAWTLDGSSFPAQPGWDPQVSS
eukprot:scaffold3350_cov268-Pinguiococcus_pyrenoidosus.AAC.12